MKIKGFCCVLLACILLLPFTVTAESSCNDALRLQLQGDVDSSGDITTTDARLMLQYAVGKVTEADVNTRLADVDGDGAVTTTDARLALQYTVGKENVVLAPEALPQTKLEVAPAGEPVAFTLITATDAFFFDQTALYRPHTLPGILSGGERRDTPRIVLIQTAEEWARVPLWHPLAPACDAAFFEENALLLCQVNMNDYGYELQVEAITQNGTTLECHFITHRLPILAAEAEYPAFGVIAIPKTALAGVDTLAVARRRTSEPFEG